jgi:hypothetical protein
VSRVDTTVAGRGGPVPAGAATGSGDGVRSAPSAAGLPTRQRRPGYTALALALIVTLAATGAWLYQQAGQKTPVVILVTRVPAGHPVTRGDLSTVDVAGPVTAVSAAHLDAVVGQKAAVDLLPGMLLQRSMLTSADPLPAGQAEVGVAVSGGRIPADGVTPGDTVAAVQVPSGGGAGDTGAPLPAVVLVARARVFSARPDPAQAGGTLITLVVPVERAPAVAAAGATGQVALVRVGAP